MSRHKNRGPRLPDFTPPAPSVVAGPDGITRMVVTEMSEFHPVASVAIQMEDAAILPRDPYRADEQTFTTRMGGPSVAVLMSEYINAFAREHDGAALLMVHPVPANNSFLFVWEL